MSLTHGAVTPLDPPPAARGGVDPDLQQIVDALNARMRWVGHVRTGAPSDGQLEGARVHFGEIIALAAQARALLPDVHGLRSGQALHRLVRAVALHRRDVGAFPDPARLATLLEMDAREVEALIRRGVMRDWLVDGDRVALTDAGEGFLGADHPLMAWVEADQARADAMAEAAKRAEVDL